MRRQRRLTARTVRVWPVCRLDGSGREGLAVSLCSLFLSCGLLAMPDPDVVVAVVFLVLALLLLLLALVVLDEAGRRGRRRRGRRRRAG